MPLITPNLKDVKDFKPLEEQNYNAKIVDVEPQVSSKGNNMIQVTFDINNGGESVSRKAWMVIEGAGAYNFESFLRACGFDDYVNQLRAGTAQGIDTDAFVGLDVQVNIKHEMGKDDKVRDTIAGYFKA
jgi:hypothetical protein